MQSGWLTNWYSKIIKIPFFLRREMRNREKIIMHALPRMKLYIYDRIPPEVLREHRVTLAMKDQMTVVKDARKAEKAESDLEFDEEVLETRSLQELTEIEKRLISHEQQHGSIGYEAEFGKKILQIMEIEEAEERKIYFTYLEPIIKIAEKKGDFKSIREAVRLLGPAQTNTMAAIALRLDIRAAGLGLKRLKTDKKRIDAALYTYDRVKENKDLGRKHLRDALTETEKDLEREMHSDALIEKRDFLLIMLTLKYMDDDETMMETYYNKHVMPKLPEEERIKDFENLKEKFAHDLHVLAQGMRRIFAQEKEAEKLAQVMIAQSKRK